MSALPVSPASPAGVWTEAELVELAKSSPALREVLRDAWNRGWKAGAAYSEPGTPLPPNPFSSIKLVAS